MNTDLNSLARTLAERLQAELSICMETGPCEVCINGAEAVIREAIDKTLEEAERAITQMLTEPRPYPFSQHVELAIKACAAEVKQLKQSNSGRAEQGIVREEWGW